MMKRTTVRAGLLALALVMAAAVPATADAKGNASCIGFEASGIAPAGSSDEFPGGVPDLQAVLRAVFGKPTGAVVSGVAHQHLGSHEACDAAE